MMSDGNVTEYPPVMSVNGARYNGSHHTPATTNSTSNRIEPSAATSRCRTSRVSKNTRPIVNR